MNEPSKTVVPPMSRIATGTTVEGRIKQVILRLVKGGPERRAIEAGQADAILDPASGSAFLLPATQRWLLDRAHARLQAEAGAPDRQARAVLDGLAAQVGVLDASGRLLSTNQAWRNDTRPCLGAGLAEQANYLAACDNATDPDRLDGLALAAGIRQVIAGERQLFCYEHACESAAGRSWFMFSVTRAAGARAARVIVSREDITGRKQGELLLELEHAVALCLAEARDAGAALKTVIRTLCETQGWDCGRYFRVDPATPVLHFHESWGVPTPAVQRFLEKSRGMTLRQGAGLKGRVYRSGQPLWVVADAADAGTAPTALPPASDRDGAFVFPVTFDHRTIGVLAFSGRTVRAPDDRMLQAVRAIGSQLGRFLQRQQALDALRRNEKRFRRLTELSTDWYWEMNRDFRFTEYVGAGSLDGEEALGKTPWDLPNLVAGSAEWTVHRTQLGERWSFCDFEFAAVRVDGKTGYYCISGEPVFDDAGVFTGYWGTGTDITRRKRAESALRESINPIKGE